MNEFPGTKLSMIERILEGNSETRKQALGIFFSGYRPALLDFLVKCKGVSANDAEDLVDDFIVNKVIEGNVLQLANGKGRFRNALRTCLQRYLIDALRKRNRLALKHDLSCDDLSGVESDGVDPLDRVWAVATLANSLCQMKVESPHWGLFVDRVLTQPPLPYDQVLQKYQYASPQKASNCLITAKRRFNRIIACHIQTQTTDDSDLPEAGRDDSDVLHIVLSDPTILREALEKSGRSEPSIDLSLLPSSSQANSRPLVDESLDRSWSLLDLTSMTNHLLDQQLRCLNPTCLTGIVPQNSSQTMRDVLLTDCPQVSETSLCQLKNYFSDRGKIGMSDLPKRLDVAIAFAIVARHVLRGHSLHSITSMPYPDLVDRFDRLTAKNWIPQELRELFRDARERILD